MSAPTTETSTTANLNGNPPPIPPTPAAERNKPRGLRKYSGYLWTGGILVVIAAAVGTYLLSKMMIREPFNGPTFTVAKQKLLVTIVERGSLESAENSDITVHVKAGAKGSTSSSTIKWVIDDGTQVQAGDKVVELDDSGFQDQLKTQKNTVNNKYSEWVQARNDTIITASQNVSDIKSKEVVLIQKDLELKKYAGEIPGAKLAKLETQDQLRLYLAKEFEQDARNEATQAKDKFTSSYLQDVSVLEGAIETAKSDKESWLDRAAWSTRMVKKNLYSASQADADQSRLASSEITLRKAQGDLDIYRKFILEQNVTAKWSDVKEAERAVVRIKIEAKSKMEKNLADEVAKKAIYDQEHDRLRDMEKEEKDYRIVSPQDGMVVYFVPEQSRGGSGSQQSIVAQGEPVREGQKLMRIPNLKKMLVNARVHEAMVSKLQGEINRPTGYGDSLRYSFALGRQDLFALASYQVAFDKERDKFRDKEQINVFPGQQAAVRVDALPGQQYAGHVRTVATVASQADWLSSDVKVYQTMVSIENTGENLKPGMSAEVTILADETREPVLVIPIQSVVGNVAMGEKRKCYVLDEHNFPQERDIEVGKSNNKMVEIRDGLQEGDKVVLNPRPLIPEKSGMKPGTPGSRRGADFDESGGGKKGGGKKGGGKKGMPGGPPGGPPGADGKSFQSSENAPANPEKRRAIQAKKDDPA